MGQVSESDISLAKDTNAIILGFNVPINNQVSEMARVEKVEMSNYTIIYQLTDVVRTRLESMLSPRQIEEEVGRGEVLSVFTITRHNKDQHRVAGLRVSRGYLDRRLRIKVNRRNSIDSDTEYTTVYDGVVETIKKHKDDVVSVAKGEECGLALPKYNDFKEGDVVTCYRVKEVPRKLGESKLQRLHRT